MRSSLILGEVVFILSLVMLWSLLLSISLLLDAFIVILLVRVVVVVVVVILVVVIYESNDHLLVTFIKLLMGVSTIKFC